jgi:hypothetical protein
MQVRKCLLVVFLTGMMILPAYHAAARAGASDDSVHWTAKYIWPSTSAIAPHENQFVQFRKTFTLAALPERARLAIFADSRYRLYVNGADIGQGPARSPKYWSYYDTFEVAPRLHVGLNVIAVEVRWYGRGLVWYYEPPDGRDHGALLCQLDLSEGANRQTVVTDTSWKATEDHAWDWNTPNLNGLGNNEVYHSDRAVKGWTKPQFDDSGWLPVTFHTNREGLSSPPADPYIHLAPRPMAYPEEREITPAKVVEAGRFPTRAEIPPYTRGGPNPFSTLSKSIASEHHTLQSSILTNAEALTRSSPSAYAEIRPAVAGQTPYVILDMGREVDGYLEFSVESAQAAALDIGWSEMLVNGNVAADTPGGNFVAQYFVAPGKQDWTMWGWHGMRFVELSFPSLTTPLKFRVGLRFSTANLDHAGSFESSSPLLTKLWQMGAYTLQLCSLDGLMDCPTREQSQWVGDAEVELRVNAVANSNLDLPRKFLLDSARDQWRDGGIPMITDSGANPPFFLDSYVLSWINALRDYYLQTGDKDFVLSLYPNVVRAMMWFQEYRQADGLLGAVPYWNFLEWSRPDSKGESSILNALYAHTLDNSAELADLAGDQYHGRIFRDDSAAIHAAFDSRFWDPTRGLYVDAWDNGRQSDQLGQLANADAILFGLAPPSRIPGILAKITDPARVRTQDFNPETGHFETEGIPRDGIIQAQTYGMFFVLEALAQQGDAVAMRRYIEQLWGPMVAAGNDTFWENFLQQAGTSCHAWSAAPPYFLTTINLGVRPTKPGYAEYVVAPHPAGLEWAKGVVPTVSGPIGVNWKWELHGASREAADRGPATFVLEIQNPAGAAALVIPPQRNAKGPQSVKLNGKSVAEPIRIKDAGKFTVEANYN